MSKRKRTEPLTDARLTPLVDIHHLALKQREKALNEARKQQFERIKRLEEARRRAIAALDLERERLKREFAPITEVPTLEPDERDRRCWEMCQEAPEWARGRQPSSHDLIEARREFAQKVREHQLCEFYSDETRGEQLLELAMREAQKAEDDGDHSSRRFAKRIRELIRVHHLIE